MSEPDTQETGEQPPKPTLKYTFTNVRKPSTIDELTACGREQLKVVARLYFGDESETDEMLGTDFIEMWDIENEDGVVEFEGWFYFVDSGTIFYAGTTDVVGEIIQFGFDADAYIADADQRARLAHAFQAAAEAITEPKKNAPAMTAWTDD